MRAAKCNQRAGVESKRRYKLNCRPAGVVRLLAILLVAATPSFAQDACQNALSQVMQNKSVILLNYENSQNTLETNHENNLLVCSKMQTGTAEGASAATACAQQENARYNNALTDLQMLQNTAMGAERNAENDIRQNPCPWTAQQVTQIVAQVGQAGAQLSQGAAQIISAAKGAKPASAALASATSNSTNAKGSPNAPNLGPPQTTKGP